MKKFIEYMAATLLAVGLTACEDFLDKEVDLTLGPEDVFNKAENTRGLLANIYTYLPDAFVGYLDGQYRGASRDCMTDNAISFWSVHYYHGVLRDSYDATNHQFANYFWKNDVFAIRAANNFLTYAKENVIGNEETGDDDNRLYDRYMAEARFLRAIFHFDMVCYFGAIPIIGDDEEGKPILFDLTNTAAMNQPRTPAADALQWVADECDKVKDVLPFRYAQEELNWGRVNGAAAYALKARALLYKASPLNNPSNDKSQWEAAAQAALDFISKNEKQRNPYRLYDIGDPNRNYYECFVSTPHLNNEYILSRSEWLTRAIEEFLAPCGFAGSTGRTNPTQNLVDSYETINGLPIDQDPSYDDQHPYDNRDPRLEQTILHHGSIWGDPEKDEQRPVDVTVGGLDYHGVHGGTVTGYYTKKFLYNITWGGNVLSTHACPIFRYAEILLNAAEALNEAGRSSDACKYVDQVRARVGMPGYGDMRLSQDKLRERIRNERRIELCFEDHRFFDERRWKLFEGVSAASERNKPRYQQVYNLYGVRITETGTNIKYNYGYSETYTSRAFNSPKNYYFPIPDKEVKSLPALGQNSGWELKATSAGE